MLRELFKTQFAAHAQEKTKSVYNRDLHPLHHDRRLVLGFLLDQLQSSTGKSGPLHHNGQAL